MVHMTFSGKKYFLLCVLSFCTQFALYSMDFKTNYPIDLIIRDPLCAISEPLLSLQEYELKAAVETWVSEKSNDCNHYNRMTELGYEGTFEQFCSDFCDKSHQQNTSLEPPDSSNLSSDTHHSEQQSRVEYTHKQSGSPVDFQKDSVADNRREMMQSAAQKYAAASDALSTSNSTHGIKIPSRSHVLRNAIALIKEKIINNSARMDQLKQEKTKLEQQLENEWWFYRRHKQEIAQAKIKSIENIQNGTFLKIATTIRDGTLTEAIYAFGTINSEWPWSCLFSHLIGDNNPEEEAFIQFLGVNPVKEAEIYLVTRPDYQAKFHTLTKVQAFEQQYCQRQSCGDRKTLELEREWLRAELSKKYFSNDNWRSRDLGFYTLGRARLAMVEAILEAPLTQITSCIASPDFSIAQEARQHLKSQVITHLEKQNIKTRDEAREHLIQTEGCDLLTIADTLIEIHPNNPQEPSTPLNQMLSVIHNGQWSDACEALQQLTDQIMTHCAQQKLQTKTDIDLYLLNAEGFNVIEAGQTLFLMRPDHPHNTSLDAAYYQNIVKQQQLERWHDIIFITQPTVKQVLKTSTNHQIVTEQLTHLCDAVFANASQFGCEINPEIDNQIQYALDLLPHAQTPAAFTFHLATVEQLLHDIQEQTALKVDVKPPLLNRSPELVARFVTQYFKNLNPITQIKQLPHGLLFAINSARYVCDVTLGKLYLSEQAYQQRSQQFKDFVNTLNNLDQLEAEHVVDMVAHIAADMTFGMGTGKALTYLKEIDALGKMQQQATRIAQGLMKGIDGVLAEEPILITAEGVAIQAPKAAEELALLQTNIQKADEIVKEVINDSKKLSEAENKIAIKSIHSKITTKQATELANSLGFKKTNYRIHGQSIFQKGNLYITIDADSHCGGIWKMADSVKNLGSKKTRMGTYDKFLNKIGD